MLQTSNELIQAIFRGNYDDCVRLLDPESANYQDAQKQSVLHAAAHCSDARVTQLLLQEGARVNTKDARWLTALHRASASNAVDVVKILLAHGADRNARDKAWQTPLHVAASNASLECMQLLFSPAESMINVNASDRMGHSPLHHAVYGGHTQVVRFLLEKGASVNAFDKRDRRAMHWAAVCGHAEVVEVLHQFGAEVNCRDKDQYTPLHAAAALGCVNTVKALIELGAEMLPTTAHGNTPLHIACLNGREEVVELLLEAIANAALQPASKCSPSVDAPSSDSSPVSQETPTQDPGFEATLAAVNMISEPGHFTPIHLAVTSTGGAYCLRLLLNAATPRITLAAASNSNSLLPTSTQSSPRSRCLAGLEIPGGEDGSHPLHMAALHGRFDRAELLLNHGAVVDARDRWGNTALHIAADRGHELFILSMIRAGCRWDVRGHGGATALHRAALSGFQACLFRLIAAALTDLVGEDQVNSILNDSSDIHKSREQLDIVDVSRFGNSPEIIARLAEIMQLKDYYGRTLVHAAALGANMDCLKLVLLSGGDPFAVDQYGRTPLHYAVASCAFAVRNPMSGSPLSPGASNLSPGFSLSPIASPVNTTPWYYRANAIADAVSASLVFLKLGAKADVQDNGGCTPLHLASAYDTTGQLVKHLLSPLAGIFALASWPPVSDYPAGEEFSGRVVDSTTTCGLSSSEPIYSPLHIAVNCGNVQAVKLLLSACPPELLHCYTIGSCFSSAVDLRSVGTHSVTSSLSPFLLAALRGNDQIMKMLLDAWTRSKWHETRKGETTQTHYDPFRNHGIAVLDRYESRGLPPGRVVDSGGHTCLHLAANAGHSHICRLLLNSRNVTGTLLRAKDSVYRWHALHHAAAQGHADVVSLLLDYADSSSDWVSVGPTDFLYEVDEHGRTALMLAAQNNHPGVIRILLSSPNSRSCSQSRSNVQASEEPPANCEVNAVDVYGRTALHRAVANGHAECVTLLLSHGADPTIRDFRQRQVLHMAVTGGKVTTLSLMLKHLIQQGKKQGEGPTSQAARDLLCPLDQYGFSPLHFAAYRGHLDCVQALLNVACYERLRGNVYTPMHCAVQQGHKECLVLLLNHFGRSYLSTKDAEGRTVLHVAAMSDQLECLEEVMRQMLDDLAVCSLGSMNHGGILTSLSLDKLSPDKLLRLASFVGDLDNVGHTALMVAANVGATSCVEMLLSVHGSLRIQLTNILPPQSSDTEDVSRELEKLSHILSPGYRDKDGRTALHHACSAPDDSAGLAILDRIEDESVIIQPDGSQRTALHLTIASGLVNLTEALINRGADFYSMDTEGRIPVLAAASSIQVANCLLISLAAMFPPIGGPVPENPFVRASGSLLSSNKLSRKSSCRTDDGRGQLVEKHDSMADNLDTHCNILMSTPIADQANTLHNEVNEGDSSSNTPPLQGPSPYPGSESDFF
ncbi:hypothetical protein CRM22_009763 [Opisthorchis felineus]|uniref:Uncharacterized protein n=1 Tax=Opisthorchis felineus TaxID=147828 RepID=A0A4S2LCB1_OPIFE|nr:hypothetical protein CRM22_009763 [Opisthorchis felineus]